MGKIRFLWDNEFDGGTFTSSTANANFPASNVQHRWWGKAWRSTVDTDPQWLKNDLGATPLIQAAAIKYNNFSAGATILLEGDNADNFAPSSYDEEMDVDNDVMALYLDEEQDTLDWWRIKISDDANVDGIIKVGRVFLGPYFEPKHSYAPGGGRMDSDDLALIVGGENGHLSGIINENLAVFRYTFILMTPADIAVVNAMFEEHRCLGGFFFTEDSDNPTTTTYYVRFAEKPRIALRQSGYGDVTITLAEAM